MAYSNGPVQGAYLVAYLGLRCGEESGNGCELGALKGKGVQGVGDNNCYVIPRVHATWQWNCLQSTISLLQTHHLQSEQALVRQDLIRQSALLCVI